MLVDYAGRCQFLFTSRCNLTDNQYVNEDIDMPIMRPSLAKRESPDAPCWEFAFDLAGGGVGLAAGVELFGGAGRTAWATGCADSSNGSGLIVTVVIWSATTVA